MVVVDTCFSDFRCVEIYRSYLRSKSIVVRNRAEFWIFCSPKFCWGHPFEKLYQPYHASSHYVAGKVS